MKQINKVEVNNEVVHLKKSFDGWRVVHPIKNEDGSWNFKNLFTGGSGWNIVKVLIFLLMIGAISWSYWRDVRVCVELTERISENPYEFCMNVTSPIVKPYVPLNISQFDSIFVDEGVEDGESG